MVSSAYKKCRLNYKILSKLPVQKSLKLSRQCMAGTQNNNKTNLILTTSTLTLTLTLTQNK